MPHRSRTVPGCSGFACRAAIWLAALALPVSAATYSWQEPQAAWEFSGPALADFTGRPVIGPRDPGALQRVRGIPPAPTR